MDDKTSQEIQCPVCFEIPQSEIFQCSNGHSFCDGCIDNLQQCPQCRVSFDYGKIRNRALENLLDAMTFDCTNKSLGCSEKVTRRERAAHQDICMYSAGTKVCDLLGFNCGFVTSKRDFKNAMDHYKKSHSFVLCHNHNANLVLEEITNTSRNDHSIWTPVLMNPESEQSAAILFLARFHPEDQTVSMTCVDLGCSPKNHQVTTVIKSFAKNKAPDISWTTTSFTFNQLRFAITQPHFRFPLNQLLTDHQIVNSVRIFISVSNNQNFGWTMGAGSIPISLANRRIAVSGSSSYYAAATKAGQAVASDAKKQKLFCNGCEKKLKKKKGRYTCLQCPKYDLCEDCMKKEEHSHHIFAVVRTKKQEATLEGYISLGHEGGILPVKISTEGFFMPKHAYSCCHCLSPITYLCLHCKPTKGVCFRCFNGELERHKDKSHVFAMMKTELQIKQLMKHLTL